MSDVKKPFFFVCTSGVKKPITAINCKQNYNDVKLVTSKLQTLVKK